MLIEVFVSPRHTLEGEAGEVARRFIVEEFLGHTFESEDELIVLVQKWPAFASKCLGEDSLAATITTMVAVLDTVDPCIKWTGQLGPVAYLREVVRIADQGLKCKFVDFNLGRRCYHTATCVVVLDAARHSILPSCDDHKYAEWRRPTLSVLQTIDTKLAPSI